MKAWTMLCALAALALSAPTTTVVSAEDCDLIKIFALVKPLESDADVKKCIAATGFELLPPPGLPTKEQVTKLCADTSCKAVFSTLQKMAIPDCTISILGGVNMKKVLNEAFGQCSPSAGAGAAAPAPAVPAPAAATPAVVPAVTPAKNAEAVKPAGAAPAPAPAVPVVPTPAPVSKAPAPAPTPASSTNKATGKTKKCDA